MKQSFYQDKLFLQTIFRIIFIVIIISFDIITAGNDKILSIELKISFVGIIILISIFYMFLIKFYKNKKFLLYLQIILDSVFTTLLLFIIKSNNVLIVFLYLLSITNSSILFFRKGAFLSAFLSYFFTIVVFVVKSNMLFSELIQDVEFWNMNVTNLAIYFIYATLITLFTEQLNKQEKIIDKNKLELEHIQILKQVIVDSIESGIIATDKKLNIIFINNMGEKIISKSLDELKKYRANEIFKDIDIQNLNYKSNEVIDDKIIGYTLNVIKKGKEIDGYLIVFKDLTQLKKEKAISKRNEKLAYIGQMTASIAHDIRNPLASISASVQMIDRFSDENKIKRLTKIAKNEIERVDSLIKEFLNYTKLDNLKLEKIELFSFFENIKNIYAIQNIAINVDFNSFENLILKADKDKMLQIFTNLIQNSIEAISKSEKIIKIYSNIAEKMIIIEDNGDGIEEKILVDIFNPFYTTKNKGTGLGLSIIYKLVDLHKGKIEIESTIGIGTKFKLCLDIYEKS